MVPAYQKHLVDGSSSANKICKSTLTRVTIFQSNIIQQNVHIRGNTIAMKVFLMLKTV